MSPSGPAGNGVGTTRSERADEWTRSTWPRDTDRGEGSPERHGLHDVAVATLEIFPGQVMPASGVRRMSTRRGGFLGCYRHMEPGLGSISSGASIHTWPQEPEAIQLPRHGWRPLAPPA
jgi:hypothetical protein